MCFRMSIALIVFSFVQACSDDSSKVVADAARDIAPKSDQAIFKPDQSKPDQAPAKDTSRDGEAIADSDPALVAKIQATLPGAWWWDCKSVPQVYLLYNFSPEQWGNLHVSSDSGTSFYRRYFDWKITDAKSEEVFLVDMTWTEDLGGVKKGEKGWMQVSGIKSKDPLTYIAYNRIVGMDCELVKCSDEWNTDQYCGKTHNMGLPKKAP
jgi:hypothetical protein